MASVSGTGYCSGTNTQYVPCIGRLWQSAAQIDAIVADIAFHSTEITMNLELNV